MSLIRDIAVFLCGFLVMNVTVAQVAVPGLCPNVTLVQNFEAEKYLGKWYEAEKYFAIFELGGKCITAEYSDLGKGDIGVTNRQINTLKGNTKQSINGTARLVSTTEASLLVKFPQAPFPAPYMVLGTDYTSYSVVWGCTNLGIFHLSFSWILTREQNPPESVLATAYEVLERNKIDRNPFQKTDQTNCPNNLA